MAITNDNFCLTVMEELAQVAGTNGDPLRNRQKTGLLDALLSERNTAGADINRNFDKGDGKNNKVIVKWLKPSAAEDTTEAITSLCDETGVESSYVYDEVTLGLEVQSEVRKLTEVQIRELCGPGSDFRMKLIGSDINAVDKKINQMLINPFYAGAGGILNGNGNVGQAYNLLYRNGLVQLDPEAMIDMQRDLMDTGMEGTPIFVGGGNFDKAMKLQMIACCNAFGADPSQMQEMMYYYDNDLAIQLSQPSDENAFFAFAPGAAQFVDRAQNVGEFRKVNDLFIHDTIVSPVTGLSYDFNLKYDDCDRLYKFKISKKFDLWQMPTTLFKATDDRFGINFNFVFQANETEVSV